VQKKTLFSSAKQDWNTPENVLKLVREYAGGQIEFDPCSGPGSIVNAKVTWCPPKHDALTESWGPQAKGVTFVNPPYGRTLNDWSTKIRLVGRSVYWPNMVVLVPSRTDTQWFQPFFTEASAICFVKGRLKFLGAANGAPFPSAIILLGGDAARFKKVFEKLGYVVRFVTARW
jgi:hypothetical protein